MPEKLTIGLIREGKVPPDKRVPLIPSQCRELMDKYPQVQVYVQPSVKRCFPDEEYKQSGIEVAEAMEECDVLMGVKEVPLQELIAGKTYFFFSHTIKKQPHNTNLLRKLLELGITMVDYEALTDKNNNRIIAFGRYAGIVGCYNAFRGYGEKFGKYKLKPAHLCFDREEMELELKKIKLPSNYKIAVSGSGRVGGGCEEILKAAGIRKVESAEFLEKKFNEPVYTTLHVGDYYISADGTEFNKAKFYKDPSTFRPAFKKWAMVADMYIPCHFWDSRAPQILEKADYLDPKFKIKIIADVSCDIGEPIASTMRPSTIADPFYGYDPRTGTEADFYSPETVGVMAVDNLPCELPRDASRDFGKILIDEIIPLLLFDDPDKIIERATICKGGKLTPKYEYLRDYVDGVS